MSKLTPEQHTTQFIRLRASELGFRVMRNNSGACKSSGRMIYFGLGKDGTKASKEITFGDYVGGAPLTITESMVGAEVAILANVEIKAAGTLQSALAKSKRAGTTEHAQLKGINFVKSLGGFACFTDDPNQLETEWLNYVNGLKINE